MIGMQGDQINMAKLDKIIFKTAIATLAKVSKAFLAIAAP